MMPITPHFTCIGAAHWDVIARPTAALSPGADMPGFVTRDPGGVALNIAMALTRSGAHAALIAAIGQDADGRALNSALDQPNLDFWPVYSTASPTGSYVAIETPEGELAAAVAQTCPLRIKDALRRLGDVPQSARIVLDGNLPTHDLQALCEGATAKPVLVPASPAKCPALAPVLPLLSCVFANLAEAEAIIGKQFNNSAEAARALCNAGAESALITDGPRRATYAGAWGLTTAAPAPLPARHAGVTGAGDALVAGALIAQSNTAAPKAVLQAALDAAHAQMMKGFA